jgi:beta-glucosidase
VGTHRALGRMKGTAVALAVVAGVTVAAQGASSAHPPATVTVANCLQRPWLRASFQHASTPAKLGALVLSCLKLRFPSTYRHDEVGIVALNAYPFFQNVNEFGLTSTVQRQLATLGMPPITLEDGPGGLITKTYPTPTQLPNELALGATFDPAMAAKYGTVLGTQAHQMGYDGVQAPDLNLVRVPSWGRAMESFGESPVLAGELGASEAVAIEARGEIPVLKHFGPYSQETDRREINQIVSERTYQELYIRPFTFALRALLPQLAAGHHAVGIMCSYGNVNATKACRSPELSRELGAVGVNALVRSDLDVRVNPTALLLNGVDLIKPMDTGQLEGSLREHAVDTALDAAVTQVFTTLFADGKVDGKVTYAVRHPLSRINSFVGHLDSMQIEERAAVLLKDTGILPLSRGGGRIAVVGDVNVQGTCRALAAGLIHALATNAACTDPRIRLPQYVLFHHEPVARTGAVRTATFTPTYGGPFVVSVTTLGNTKLTMNGAVVLASRGTAEFDVQRTALVHLVRGARYTFVLTWRGAPPIVWLVKEGPLVAAMVNGVHGARAAIVVAYDLPREGMDRSSLELPNAQEAIISAVAAKVPTVVVLATSGAVVMPWLSQVKGVLEVWNPTGMVNIDQTLTGFVPAWIPLLDGRADPSGRLPVTFPLYQQESPMADQSFWPGVAAAVNLDLPPNGGVGIGYAWYRQAGWPILFPFGYGLSYTTFQLLGGTVTDGASGLQASVAVRDTGGVAGSESVQVYASWPGAADEPRTQLVGFGTVSFTKQAALAGTVEHAVLTLSPDAFTVYDGTAMRVLKGTYCLEASAYEGDPHSWSTGSITLGPGAKGSVAGPATTSLTASSCPA